MTVMYIHGYGSDGNAMKGRLLRGMLPGYRVVSPTFDYLHCTPWQVQDQIRSAVEREGVGMIVGSSFGGYHALCATSFFHGVVWVVNPVHDVEETIRRVVVGTMADGPSAILTKTKTVGDALSVGNAVLDVYREFDAKVFDVRVRLNQSGQWPADTPLNFALSTDDELLGDHHVLLDLFPCHREVVWKEQCGHRFLRFGELADAIASSAAWVG